MSVIAKISYERLVHTLRDFHGEHLFSRIPRLTACYLLVIHHGKDLRGRAFGWHLSRSIEMSYNSTIILINGGAVKAMEASLCNHMTEREAPFTC